VPAGHYVGAAAPGPVTPAESDNAPEQGRVIERQEQWDDADSARAAIARHDKLISTLRARAALAGITMHVVADEHGRGAYLLTRWCLSRELPDLRAVGAFLDQVGAPDAS
jgi:hypothetical protein